MSLSMAKVFQEASHFTSATNCYFQNLDISCMVDGRSRAMRWEARKASSGDLLYDNTKLRMFSSDEDGATWSLIAESAPPFYVTMDTLYSPGGDRLLIGASVPTGQAFNATYSLISRSEDAGATWTSAISSGLFNSITLASRAIDFVRLPGTDTVLAFGQFEFGGIAFQVLRSTDAGQTFTSFADTGLFFTLAKPIALSATELVAVGNSVNPMWSSDGGATWTESTKPSLNSIQEVVHLTGDTVLGIGRNPSSLGRAFISTDKGHTFTTLVDIGNNSASFLSSRALTAQIAIAGGTEASGPTANQDNWWITEDAGATWAQASLTGSRTTPTSTGGLTITRTGIVLADIDQGPTTGISAFAEIWRGAVVGFVGPGTCEGAEFPQPPPEVEIGVPSILLNCVPIFTPPPCPPLCPTDPLQPEGVLVLPSGRGGGFLSPLFLLGLVTGSGGLLVTTGTLGVSTTCGATFANNHCAVAGCQ
jgi:hypothetical protein